MALANFGIAQTFHDPSDQIQSINWDIIGNLKFKTVSETEKYPVFTSKLKSLAGKEFEVEGYLVPIRDGMTHRRFLLSTLPINQCFYCGKNGVPIMIEVVADEPVKFTYKPIVMKGSLQLSEKNAAESSPIMLVNSKQSN